MAHKRSSNVNDKRVINVNAVDSEKSESIYESIDADENDFMFVQANDLDRESMQFQIQNEEQRSVHWAVSAGHEPSLDLYLPKESVDLRKTDRLTDKR